MGHADDVAVLSRSTGQINTSLATHRKFFKDEDHKGVELYRKYECKRSDKTS